MCEARKCFKCKERNAESKRKVCRQCRYAKEKENLAKWSFNTHRRNAKRRGIEWKLTFLEFLEFATKTQLLIRAGRFADSYHIDRIDNLGAYEVGNIQVLTNKENVTKYIHYDEARRRLKVSTSIIRKYDPELDPF